MVVEIVSEALSTLGFLWTTKERLIELIISNDKAKLIVAICGEILTWKIRKICWHVIYGQRAI